MKKTLLLKTLLLLCVLIVGSTSAWAQSTNPNWSYTIVTGDNSKLNTTAKTFTVDATHVWSYDGTTAAAGTPAVTMGTASSTYGLKFGSSGSNYFNPVILSTNAFNDKAVTKVRIYVKHNGGKVGKLTVKQGEITIGTATTASTSDWINVTCSETNKGEGGALEIKYEVAQAIYINKIEVWYDDLGTTHTLSSSVLPSGSGTVALGSTTIVEGKTTTATATANDGYRFVNWTVTGAGSSVSNATANPATFTMGTEDATITANFEAIPTHTVTWSVNGAETSEDVAEGVTITFPANPVDLAGKNFVGWTKTSIVGETDVKPSLVTSEVMGTEDVAFYAVYATVIGTPATLTKMASDETLSDGDKIVIVANDGTTEYGLYQKESKSKYIDKYVFDGQVETVAADDLNWVTANAEEGGLWSFGDATNGYIYNSSGNEFKIVTDNKTSFTVAYNSDNNGFTIKNGSRWFAYRADLTEANRLFRGAGESTTPTDGSVAYFDIYKYVAGNASYSGYCTSITVSATISDAGYATFSNASAVDFSSNAGLSVYYVSSTAENKAEMVEIGSKKVPASTGVLLKGAAGNYSGAVTTGVDALVGNLLFACVDGYDATVDNEIYILANGGSGVGFYPIKGGTSLGAGKAYIGGGDVNAKCLTLSFGSETTAINGVEEVAPANVKTRKVVKNGRLVIETANGEFTIDGARVK